MEGEMKPAAGAAGKAESAMNETSSAAMAAHSEAIPMADEPLEAGNLNALADAVKGAISSISDGEIEPEVAEVAEEQDKVPPDLGQLILGIGALVKEYAADPAFEKYQFDPIAEMKSNDGIVELAGMIDQLGRDGKAKKAFLKGEGAGGGKPTETEQPGADIVEQE